MPQLSPEQLAPMMAIVEAVYGTQPGAWSPTTSGFLTITSPNAVESDMRYQQILPHQVSWTKQKDIPTTALQPINFTFPLMGGTSAIAGFRASPIFRCAGMKETIGATIIYTPATPADVVSASIAQELPGYVVGSTAESIVEEANGCFGNIIFRGTAETGLMAEFRGLGLFQDAQESTLRTLYGAGTNAWSGGANNANKFILTSPNQLTINNGAGVYAGVVNAMEFDLGVEVTPIPDVNSGATFGFFTTLITDRNPRLTLTIALDTAAAALVSYQDLKQDAQDGTTHAVTWKYTDLSTRTLLFTIPTAQLIGIRKGTANKIRTVQLTYKVQHATSEAEFTITHA
jgi:hypothetical protein